MQKRHRLQAILGTGLRLLWQKPVGSWSDPKAFWEGFGSKENSIVYEIPPSRQVRHPKVLSTDIKDDRVPFLLGQSQSVHASLDCFYSQGWTWFSPAPRQPREIS